METKIEKHETCGCIHEIVCSVSNGKNRCGQFMPGVTDRKKYVEETRDIVVPYDWITYYSSAGWGVGKYGALVIIDRRAEVVAEGDL